MPKRIYALIKPELLVWARESIGYDLDSAAEKLKISTERLSAWENGDEHPTIPQLRKLSQLYKRPIAIFYLPQPPQDFDALHDFRRLPDHKIGYFSPELIFEIRTAQQRRMSALDLAAELNEELLAFKPTFRLHDSIPKAAEIIRESLQIPLSIQQQWNDDREALNSWIEAFEALDILVFQTSKVVLKEMRGFAIAADILPIIVLNGKDSVRGRIFTLLHEHVHLLLGETGVSDFSPRKNIHTRDDRVEVYCNAVAAETLAPLDSLLSQNVVANHGNDPEWNEVELDQLAKHYHLSQEVILRRLLDAGKTTSLYYETMRNIWLKRCHEESIQKSTGGPPYPTVQIRNMGGLFIRLALEAFYANRINANNLATLLQMKYRHVATVEKMMLGGS